MGNNPPQPEAASEKSGNEDKIRAFEVYSAQELIGLLRVIWDKNGDGMLRRDTITLRMNATYRPKHNEYQITDVEPIGGLGKHTTLWGAGNKTSIDDVIQMLITMKKNKALEEVDA